jgi:glycogen(starch) synthase
MTRIVFFTESFWPSIGGVEVLASPFGEAMIERGYDFVVVTGRTEDETPDVDEYRGIEIHRFPFVQTILRRQVEEMAVTMSRLTRLYADLRPDVFHVNFTGPGVMFHVSAAARHPAPTVVAIQVAIPERRDQGLLAGRLLRSAEWVTANSQRMLEYTRSLVPEIASRSSTIYNGLPLPPLDATPSRLDEPLLLCLGRVVADKGFDLAIRALPAVLARAPGARLVIAGDGSDRANLESMAVELGVDRQVDFTGRIEREQVPALIESATMVLMPSRWEEAFGLVALEAAQMARPVVATRVGGLPEVVVDRETGLLVPREDPGALADAIIELITDRSRAREMGLRARERSVEVFGWARYVDEYEELYCRLIRERTTLRPSGDGREG